MSHTRVLAPRDSISYMSSNSAMFCVSIEVHSSEHRREDMSGKDSHGSKL